MVNFDAIETSSELVALLVEDEAIRQFQPKFNVAQKKRKTKAGIFEMTVLTENLPICVFKETILPFSSRASVQSGPATSISSERLGGRM